MSRFETEGAIEITFDVVATTSASFWIDKAEWEAMSQEDKTKKLELWMDLVASFSNEPYEHNDDEEGDFSINLAATERDLAQEPTIYYPAE